LSWPGLTPPNSNSFTFYNYGRWTNLNMVESYLGPPNATDFIDRLQAVQKGKRGSGPSTRSGVKGGLPVRLIRP